MPDNGIALERREAQGSSQGPARPGTPTALKDLGLGSLAREGWLIAKPAEMEPRTLHGASRRSITSCERDGKREGGPARAPEFKSRARGALAR